MIGSEMQTEYEFRVNGKYANRLFGPNDGKDIGSVRVIRIGPEDPRFAKIGEFDRLIDRETDGHEYFFAGWQIRRRYTKEEVTAAACFRLTTSTVFEPAGESCGTQYDESTACPKCGAGAAQVSDLRLDLRKVPKSKEIATTIANEIIISQRLAERLTDAGLTGFELRPVRHKARYEDDPLDLRQIPLGREIIQKAEAAGAPYSTGRFDVWANRAENRPLLERARAEYAVLKGEESKRSGEPMPVWHQLVVTANTTEIVAPTRVGIDPFDDDPKGECRCPSGDLIGLNLLSEVSIRAASRGNADIVCSRQFIGARRGLLRPNRVMLISPKFWNFIESESLKGIKIEVAHLV
jgi:hypothetical protein